MTRSEKIAAIRARRAAAKASGKRMPAKRRPPRQIYPHGLEREYERAMLRQVEPFFAAVKAMLGKDLPGIIEARDRAFALDDVGAVRHDAYADLIGLALDGIRVNVAARISEAEAAQVSKSFAQRVAEFNRTQVDRQFAAVLGIPVLRQERWLADKLSAFVTGNVSLIKDIGDKGVADVSAMIMARVEAGDSLSTISKAIEQRLEVVQRRAQFIARDQVSKLNGKLTELRQREVGVEKYRWRAVKDGATRASHLQNDFTNSGLAVSWDDPPETGHPGEDYQCRCSAEPVLDEFIAQPMQEAA
jgi:SPP1 gp7 family putative phage head morphogenesis protein